ncbi:hypothetical protein ACQP1W_21980 [Spirillospora sp. CA-255316]
MAQISRQLDRRTTHRLRALVAAGGDDPASDEVGGGEPEDGEGAAATVLSLIKSGPGNVSLVSMMTEIDKLRAIGLPTGLTVWC